MCCIKNPESLHLATLLPPELTDKIANTEIGWEKVAKTRRVMSCVFSNVYVLLKVIKWIFFRQVLGDYFWSVNQIQVEV